MFSGFLHANFRLPVDTVEEISFRSRWAITVVAGGSGRNDQGARRIQCAPAGVNAAGYNHSLGGPPFSATIHSRYASRRRTFAATASHPPAYEHSITA